MAQTTSGHVKNFELNKFASDSELAHSVASLWLDKVRDDFLQKVPHSVALSGGRITGKFFSEIVRQAGLRNLSLHHIDFFWADERCVPPGDPESNFALANRTLFQPLKIAEEKIHRLCGELEPASAVEKANRAIRKMVPANAAGEPVLTTVFLGVGEDGHVASLFPNASREMNDSKEAFYFVENSPKPPPRRITLSYAALAAAREVWVIASGKGKESVLIESLSENGQTPLARVVKSRQMTKVFTDLSVQ